MKIGSVAIAYNEERFITSHLKHLDVDEKLVLLSTKPWQGKAEELDETFGLAQQAGAVVIPHDWKTEEEQRNDGQKWFEDMDWIWTLDPDEFLTKDDQLKLKEFLKDADLDAYVCERQLTYWKSGYVISPPEEYKQIIAVRPGVQFVDKRVVNTSWGYAPVVLHHFSWARTDSEVWSKISHYSHGHEFNKEDWFGRVWRKWTPEMRDLHPLTPEALEQAVPAKLPKELEDLNLWPS